jgi:hypothetical protein
VIDHPFTVREVRGTVTFKGHPGEPLSDVLFEIIGPGQTKVLRHAMSDRKGRFDISHVANDTYRFKATRDGFSSVVGTIAVSRKAEREDQIRIEAAIGN